jgi:hypothetical protein
MTLVLSAQIVGSDKVCIVGGRLWKYIMRRALEFTLGGLHFLMFPVITQKSSVLLQYAFQRLSYYLLDRMWINFPSSWNDSNFGFKISWFAQPSALVKSSFFQ